MRAILKYHKIGYHVYADDTQLYISFKCKQPLESISKVNSSLSDIRRWMITNKLKINDSKTEFIVFRSPQLRCDFLYVEAHIFILETLEKLGICYRIMLVLLLFMHLLVVD